MIKYFKIFFLSFLFASLGVYGQNADIVKGCVPLKVNFTAPPSATTYFWDFKDGVTSNLQNPSNLFTKAGKYVISFQETVGGPIIKTIEIEVFKEPVLSIQTNPGCYPLTSEIKSTITIDPQISITNYNWVFGDGGSIQGKDLTSTKYVYNNKGVYDISLGIQTNFPSCNTIVIFNEAIKVYDPPIASYTTNPINLITCNSTLNVEFKNTSTGAQPLSYLWDLGSGKTSTLATPPNQTYTSNYSPKLTVKFTSNLVGCQSSNSKDISVGRPIPTIKKIKDTVCIYDTVMIISTSIGKKLWTVGANALIKGDNSLDTIFVYFSKSGKNSISLKVTTPDGVCSDTKTIPIFIDEVLATIQHSPQNSCTSPLTVEYKAKPNQSDVSYEWSFNDGTLNNNSSTSKTYTSKTSPIYYGINTLEPQITNLIVTSNKTGCKIKVIALDTLWLPNARIMPNISKGCAPLTVTFSDSSRSNDPIIQWKWLFGNGTTKTNASKDPQIITFTEPGKYENKIVITSKKGCIDTSYSIIIEVGGKIPNLDFVATKTEVCPGEMVTFNAVLPSGIAALGDVKGYHFTTEGNRSFNCSKDDNLSWAYNYLSGPQDVSLTVDMNGCFTTVNKKDFINVKGSIARIDYSAACNDPFKYHFKDVNTNATSLTWDFGDLNSGSIINETHVYNKSGDYNVVLTALEASSGCPASKDSVVVNVRGVKAQLDSDSLFCLNASNTFNAFKSVDVNTNCHKGYNWQIPNSGIPDITSSSSIQKFIFSKAGIFTVRLIVSDVNGCKDTLSRNIKVFDIKPLIAADDLLICNPGIVNFTDQSIGDTTLVGWNWYFGDKEIASIQNPTHTYLSKPELNSTYTIYLIVTDKIGCKDTTQLNISHYVPSSTIIASKDGICLGQTVTLSAADIPLGGSPLSYKWDFGNATSSVKQSNNSVLYATDQIYNVVLDIQEISTGCKGKSTKPISVQTYPKALFTTSVDTNHVLCAPQPITFTDKSTSKYPITNSWKFGNGQVSTNATYTLVYPKGNYNVQHIVSTSNGCADTTNNTYKVFRPEGTFIIDKNSICKGDSIHFEIKDTIDVINYIWAFGDGIVMENINPINHAYHFHPPSGSTIVRLSLKSNEGCNAQIQKPINIYQVIADFNRLDGIDSSICFNDGPYQLTNTSIGATNYYWDFGDGLTSNSKDITNHTYASPGMYEVLLAISSENLGCVDTIKKPIVIFENPVVKAIGDTVCQSVGIVSLQVTNPNATSTYKWTPNTGLLYDTSLTTTATIQHSVLYQIEEKDKNGCTDKKTVPAIIIEPINFRSLDTSIVIGDIITLPVNGAYYNKFSWDRSDGLSCSTCNYPSVQPLEDIIYNLTVTDVRNCYPKSSYYNIKIKPQIFVKMPSMFTPNGDGNNDAVFVNGWGIKNLLEYQIFNRWGQLIFTTNDIHEGWDGTFNGALQSSDIYVYKVKVMTWKNVEIKEEGYINLVR